MVQKSASRDARERAIHGQKSTTRNLTCPLLETAEDRLPARYNVNAKRQDEYRARFQENTHQVRRTASSMMRLSDDAPRMMVHNIRDQGNHRA